MASSISKKTQNAPASPLSTPLRFFCKFSDNMSVHIVHHRVYSISTDPTIMTDEKCTSPPSFPLPPMQAHSPRLPSRITFQHPEGRKPTRSYLIFAYTSHGPITDTGFLHTTDKRALCANKTGLDFMLSRYLHKQRSYKRLMYRHLATTNTTPVSAARTQPHKTQGVEVTT